MNQQPPYLNPFNYPQSSNINIELDKILNKINRLEKEIKIIDNRLSKIENNQINNSFIKDDPTDMYII